MDRLTNTSIENAFQAPIVTGYGIDIPEPPVFRFNLPPTDLVAGIDDQMLEHQPLGATVSFPKRVQHIDVTVIFGHGGDQVSAFAVLKPTILREPREYFFRFRFNAGDVAKPCVVFGDVHGADLASPIIDILE
ncbi:hypothetical protein GCM10023339_78810 [Alloalcanivorax gelatiniphagus]